MYRVVLVDDEQIILQGLQRAFPWAEYDCEVAGVAMDGQEGLKLIREVKPDLLLTDICMPNMDGLTMIAALKSAFPAMQVAVLTAYRDFDYAQKALNLGVCRYLLKPSNMEQLREAISTMKARLDEAPPAPSALEPQAEPAESSREAAAFIARVAMKRRPKPIYTIRLDYQFFVFLTRILPGRTLNWLIGLLYAK